MPNLDPPPAPHVNTSRSEMLTFQRDPALPHGKSGFGSIVASFTKAVTVDRRIRIRVSEKGAMRIGTRWELAGETYLVPEASHRRIAPAARSGRVKGQNPRSDPYRHLLHDVMSSDSYVCDLVSHENFMSGIDVGAAGDGPAGSMVPGSGRPAETLGIVRLAPSGPAALRQPPTLP